MSEFGTNLSNKDIDFKQQKTFKEFKAEENETPLTVEESLAKFDNLVKNSNKLILITDLDGTILQPVKNPSDYKVNEQAQKALERINKSGVQLAVITGRSGKDSVGGQTGLNIPGAIIIGTWGWEVYKVDDKDVNKGESFVNEKLSPYPAEITDFLNSVENDFLKFLQENNTELKNLTHEIGVLDGKIFFEEKSVNKEFTHGISIGFNLNSVDKEKWDNYIDIITESFNKHLQNLPKNIGEIYKLKINKITNCVPPTLSISISPQGEKGKHASLVQILRSNEDINPITRKPKRKEIFRDLPGGFDSFIYFGDTNQDAEAIRISHLSALLTKKNAACVVVETENSSIGSQDKAMRYADVKTRGVEDNARLLTRLADLIEKYKK